MEGSGEDAFHFGNGRRHAVQLVGGHIMLAVCGVDVNPNLRIVYRAERAMPPVRCSSAERWPLSEPEPAAGGGWMNG